MTRKEKEAIQILHDYANDLRRKGIKFPEPKDDKQLAALVISFLETEYRVEDERLNHHQQTSTMNISDFDKRFIAAEMILRRETKKEGFVDYKFSYAAYDNDGNEIALEYSIRKLTKTLQALFKSKYKVTEYIIKKAIKADNLNFKWGSIEINDD
ncbi:hypothetical protein BGL41_04610 [Fructilactobacillus sanfranciscensis]|nr:hypothetical protein BGL41_04610 [Fructilactobacillus sanfranciscensis]